MKPNEIKKALELCGKTNQAYKCTDCPYYCKSANCLNALMSDVSNYINQLEADKKEITEKFECQQAVYCDLSKIIKEQAEKLKIAKSEAIKEFVERLKMYKTGTFDKAVECRIIPLYAIDNSVKEMVGENF